MRDHVGRARLAVVASMCIFGTIGLFRRFLPLPSGFLAMARGLSGAAFLLLYTRLRSMRLDGGAIRGNFMRLLLSGALMGFNWILLFEAYRYTTVAAATLCYYMAPVFVLLAAAPLFHERLTPRKLLCAASAICGAVLVSGVTTTGVTGGRGVLLGLGAAALYAGVVILNKTMRGVGACERTILQLGAAGVVIAPYVVLTESFSSVQFTPVSLLLLAVVCIVHTGAAYALYFGSVDALSAQSLALLSYLDPVVAVLLSAFVLHESITLPERFGALLILCAAIIAELPEKT